MNFSSGHIAILGAYLTLGVLFSLGLIIPLGFSFWLFYFIPIVFIAASVKKNGLYLITILSTILIFTGWFIAPAGNSPSHISLVNRVIGTTVIWVITILIAQRKSIKEAFEASEYQFRTVFEQSPIGKEIFNADGILLKVNKSFLEMFGISSEKDIMGSNLFNFQGLPSNILDKLKSGNSINYEVQYSFDEIREKEIFPTTRSGIAFLQEIITPLMDSNRKVTGYLLQVQDTTSRKIAEINLKKAVSDLEASNKDLEKFAYVASHDLQEPLRMIGSYTQLLAKRYKGQLDSDADDFINYAVEGANRMRQLINDLLTYSRLTTKVQSFVAVNCNYVIESILDNLNPQIKESNAIISYDELPIIFADENQISLLFQHLISNAVKFQKDQEPLIHISSQTLENEWLFSVKDNGIGIDPSYHDRIFVIFQRLNNRQNYIGTGIGLAICKKIVEQHGGHIWVDSQLSEGATFYFTISKTKGFGND